MKTRQLVIDAMLIAAYFILSTYLSVNLGSMRISLDLLPVVLGAALFGPAHGFIIGFAGYFLFQLVGPYGISVTTFIWCLPEALRGLIAGFVFYGRMGNGMELKKLTVWLVVINLITTALYTLAMYIDCLVFKYSFVTYSPFILWRCLAALIVSGIAAIVLPPLMRALENAASGRGSGKCA